VKITRDNLLQSATPIVHQSPVGFSGPVPRLQAPHVRMVKHVDKFYFVVFKDETTEYVTDIWHRDFKAKDQRRCVWSHLSSKKPTRMHKDISFKAMTAPLGQ